MSADKQIAFFPDVSRHSGLGHLKRCLSLAESFQELGWSISFLLHEPTEVILDLVKGHRFSVVPICNYFGQEISDSSLPLSLDVIVLDGYNFDNWWQTRAKLVANISVLITDPQSSAAVSCDVVLDSSPSEIPRRYCIPGSTKKLFGSQYALIPKLARRELLSHEYRQREQSLFVVLGGSDPQQQSYSIAQALVKINRQGSWRSICLVTGPLVSDEERER